MNNAGTTEVGRTRATVPLPGNEPTVLGRASDLLNHVAALERNIDQLNGGLFGFAEPDAKRPEPSTLEGLIAEANERLAILCGTLSTMNSRLGCCPVEELEEPARR